MQQQGWKFANTFTKVNKQIIAVLPDVGNNSLIKTRWPGAIRKGWSNTMIINLTQHASTADQQAAGVVDLPESARASLQKLLTFDNLPYADELYERAVAIAQLAEDNIPAGEYKFPYDVSAMIGGAPYLMSYLERELTKKLISPVYAFSRRVVEERHNTDGTVSKVAVFKHGGFVRAY